MDTFSGKLAVVTGGGTGMGRELTRQLAADGCAVAICDISATNMADTVAACEADAPGVTVTSFVADVSKEPDWLAFRDHVLAAHATDHVDLLFNNAGIGGGNSFLTGSRESWDKTFAVCWGGVYNGMRAFADLIVASDDAYVVNTSSVNGFWAALAPGVPHTAYSTAKFAVKGFSEALIEDLRMNAPHVKVAVVMPGHIGTDIVANSRRILGNPEPEDMTAADLDEIKQNMARRGLPVDTASDDDLRNMVGMLAEMFKNNAPTTAAQAATVILDGVRAGKWRILVGDDAHALDAAVRNDPERAYEPGGPNLGTIVGG